MRLHKSGIGPEIGVAQTGQETENASSDETCLPKSQVRPEIRLAQTEKPAKPAIRE
ncbi:hypothetical protein BIFPSEUDO_03237 [Bifidobacterium pseudocatenulatum DSM 20438 = JCM 1200 = LMG 10505]|uniref:Uncharacterized protein n=1 Tax=Bifidobacterium pseudocatenulatum DSM 20438 = JCM 1200 = LMG 10505 TaxID=547043 RepID=C0BRH3_BIFPS|nr:hypothetical protein BIFPSEUDO_03237 [Bifidobacterium pseudocatenulatum DSM 20438 = JCM 1200 = LMG 10505]BAR04228.1 hypothetical protein BBPC_1550 [Bifidobacterium pseudocatenulatum DSM 20438 = JCM 1200 = LMG 10505]